MTWQPFDVKLWAAEPAAWEVQYIANNAWFAANWVPMMRIDGILENADSYRMRRRPPPRKLVREGWVNVDPFIWSSDEYWYATEKEARDFRERTTWARGSTAGYFRAYSDGTVERDPS